MMELSFVALMAVLLARQNAGTGVGQGGLTVTTTPLPEGTIGTTQLNATGGTGALSWASSDLPAGLTLSPAGALSGTPAVHGPESFTVTVTDSATPPNVASAQLTVSVLGITPTSLPEGAVGTAYPATLLTTTGGTGTVIWAISSGTLPAGLALSPAGLITGTPAAAGQSAFTVTVTDSATPPQTATAEFTIDVAQLTITTPSLAPGAVGNPYRATQLNATGGTGALSWAISSGALPAGLQLTSTGVLLGSPAVPGQSAFTVTVTDSATPPKAASIQLSILVLGIATTILPEGAVGTPYPVTSLVSAGGAGTLNWAVSTGALPAGLTLSGNGVITGTPTTPGASSFTVMVTDSGTPAQSVMTATPTTGGPLTFTLAVAENATSPQTASAQLTISVLGIITASLPAGAVGTAYSAPLVSAGGTGALSWAVSSGSLPAGLTLSQDGIITGTPTVPGQSAFTVAVADSATPPQTATTAFTIDVAQLTIIPPSLPEGAVGMDYPATQLNTTGSTGTLSFAISSGALPAGLTLSQARGMITGTPTAAGQSAFTVTVTDSATPPKAASIELTISVLGISTTFLPEGAVETFYSAPLVSAGGTGALSWTISSGTLPDGLTLSQADGVITGTPTAAGQSAFAVAVTDSATPAQTTSAQLSISVLGITTISLPPAAVRVRYSAPLETAGGTGALIWAISNGALPAGLTLSQTDGVITGTPTPKHTAPGPHAFTVAVTDSATPPQTATTGFTIHVAREPVEVPQVPEGHEQARHTLTNLGLAVSDEILEAISDKPARTVVGTYPPGGSLVAPATMITLVVSNTTEVPPVIGSPAEAAEETLIRAGFTVTTRAEGKASGSLIVRSQTPEGGSWVPRHSNVHLVLAAPEYDEPDIAPSRARGRTSASTEAQAGRTPRSSRPTD